MKDVLLKKKVNKTAHSHYKREEKERKAKTAHRVITNKREKNVG